MSRGNVNRQSVHFEIREFSGCSYFNLWKGPLSLKSCSAQNGTVSSASPVKSFRVANVPLAILWGSGNIGWSEDHSLDLLALHIDMWPPKMCSGGQGNLPSSRCVRQGEELEEHVRRKAGEWQVLWQPAELYLGYFQGFLFSPYADPCNTRQFGASTFLAWHILVQLWALPC